MKLFDDTDWLLFFNPHLFGGGAILPGRFSYSNKKILLPRYFLLGDGRASAPLGGLAPLSPSPGIDATASVDSSGRCVYGLMKAMTIFVAA